MKHNTRHWVGITAGILSLAGYASAATLGSEKYTYDASGNIIEKSIDGVVTKMSFDRSNRLIERQTTGQDTETTAYDAAGRPVTERNADGQTTGSMSYGYGDKVLKSRSHDTKARFYYNAEGQLVGKNVGGNVSTYTWDGNVLAAEGAEAFANEAHISGGVPVLASGRDVVVSDHLGNTLVSGEKQFISTAYGEGLEQGRFTGKPFVSELGCYVFNHRNYSPLLACWNVADPSGFPNGTNSSAYASSDPVTRIDPLGLVDITHLADTFSICLGFTHTVLPLLVSGTGTVKVVPVDKGGGHICYRPVVDIPYSFVACTRLELPIVDEVLLDHTTDQTFADTTYTHESWHRTIFETIATKSYGALEEWSKTYGTNGGAEYGTWQQAFDGGTLDFWFAYQSALTTWETGFGNRNYGEGSPEQKVIDGKKVWRSVNPDWGSGTNAMMQDLYINPYIADGNCEY